MLTAKMKHSAARVVEIILQLVPLQMVYVMTDLRFRGIKPPVAKVGISGRLTDCRRQNIEQSIRDKHGKDVKIKAALKFPVFAPMVIETAIHEAFKRFRSDVYQGTSGGTEWFAWRNWIAGYFVFLLGWSWGLSVEFCLLKAAVILLLPLPLDLILCVSLLGLFQWTVLALVVRFGLWPVVASAWEFIF